MIAPLRAPCGSWPSPITPDRLASASLRLGACAFGADGSVYFTEGRPAEKGRGVLVRRRPDGALEDVTPAPHNVRSRVHEYGGVAYAVATDGAVVFVDDRDQRLWLLPPGGAARPIEGTPPGLRFADLQLDERRGRVLCVAEHHDPGRREPRNLLVAVGLADGRVTSLAEDHDFFAAPCLSPAGDRLAYLAWDHPHMPWDAATLYERPLDEDGRPGGARRVAGSPEASAFQPGYAADGTLLFVWEPEGFWNLHEDAPGGVRCVARMPAELGVPLWGLGTRTWGLLDDGSVVAACVRQGQTTLVRIDRGTGAVTTLPCPVSAVGHLAARGQAVALVAGFADRPGGVCLLPTPDGAPDLLRASSALGLEPGFVSVAEPVSFPTTDGDVAHGFFYPPRHPGFLPPEGERPPLLVLAHGGPTGATSPALSLAVQFWTTRGFAVLDVNYRGSSGYGRAYRDRLRGAWGVRDVDDCVAGARHLGVAGRVDDRRLAIRGSSAGGFTVLAALTFRDVFTAGASLYGVADLEALARDTHKFEAHYTDALVGPYPAARDLYQARSPVHAVDRLSCPVIFFQGLEDKIVPPSQAEAMVEALRRKGLTAEYLAFEGEQHGFRRAETIRTVYEAELAFYGRVFGFSPASG
jgi:dipeptidyl aminopeptidase/acylaminoacyl peptidase